MTTPAIPYADLVRLLESSPEARTTRSTAISTKTKRPHHKVRTGCDTCKRRRVKCDEAQPECRRCLKAEVQCEGYKSVPKVNLFTPAQISKQSKWPNQHSNKSQDLILSENEESFSKTDDQLIELPYINSRNRDTAFNARQYTIYHPPSSPFRDQEEFQAHNLSLHWIYHYTCSRVLPELAQSGFWTQTVPQIAWEYDCLRNAMIAFGLLGASFHRRDSLTKYNSETIKALEYSNHAIRSVSADKPPNMVIALCALMFWQIELLRGNVHGSVPHITAAYQIAGQSKEKGTEVQLTARIAGRLARGSRNVLQIGTTVPKAVEVNQPASLRKRDAMLIILQTLPEIATAIKRTKACQPIIPYCESILSTLGRVRRELIWIIARWGNKCSPKILSRSNEVVSISKYIKSPQVQDEESLFAEPLRDLDKYLNNGGDFSIEWFQRDVAQVIPSFLLVVASDDLGLRQDLAEFMEASRLIREAEDEFSIPDDLEH